MASELAQELAVETFLQAFRARRRFAGVGDSALPWLYGIAGNLLRMNQRTEERRLRAYARAAGQRAAQPAAGGDVDVGVEDAEARLDAAALGPALAAALAALSAASREVLLLHA